MNLTDYRALTEHLRATLAGDTRVLGLIALGSMAEVTRLPDAWSDHDFFVITVPDAQEHFRQDVTWLPDPDQIVLNIRETAHGLKILYASGHLLEFAVFDEAELAETALSEHRVLLDRSNITALAAARASQAPDQMRPDYDPQRDLAMALALIYVGVGRLARGEGLSAHVFIKYYVLHHLLPLLVHLHDSEQKAQLDGFDPFRRFEAVFPALGAKLNRILAEPLLVAAHALLDWLDAEVQPLVSPYPQAALRTVRAYLATVETSLAEPH